MSAILLSLAVPLVATVLSWLLVGLPLARGWKRALSVALVAAIPLAIWPLLPDELLARGLVLVGVAFNTVGNLVAFDGRVRDGSKLPRTLASYVVDVLTVSSSRLVPELATPGASVPGRAARGLAFGALSVGATLLLREVPAGSLPLLAWLYLKLHVIGFGAQAVSDLIWAASGGTVVPLMRLPLLSTSFLDFWGRRYNLWIHGALLWIARDVLGLSRRPRLLLVAAFLVSGALHEILSFLVLREVHGWWMGFWVAQLALTFVSVKLARLLRGTRAGPIVGLLFVHVGLTLSAPLFFAVLDRVWNLFGTLTPAPW